MPTYMLEGTVPVALSPRPLTVTLQLEGPVAGTIQALADGRPVANAVRPRPELLILPSVEGRLLLHVEPVAAAVFAQGSRAHVSVGVNDPGAVDPERAVLPPIDLAGLSRQEVLSLERTADGLRVRSEVREAVRVDLGPLADAARVAATEIVGVQRLGSDRAVDVAIAVDASASFRRTAASGQLRRALDLLEGVASVVDPNRRASAVLLTRPAVEVVPGEGESLADAVLRGLAAVTPTTGTPLAERLPGDRGTGTAGGRAVRYVLTDAAPADPAALGSGPERAHLVVLGHGSAWALQSAPGVAATLVDVDELGPVGDGADPLAGRPERVRPLVASLLDELGAPVAAGAAS